jgi:PilZ domain
MGRDITIGGMRVNPNPLLEVGMNVELAIHTEEREMPLVVRARVHRNDGDRGMVLRFHELAPDASRFLNEVMDPLPLVDATDDGRGCLVTEILATG